MEKYGWTIIEVKQQPYFEVLDLLALNKEDEASRQQKEEKLSTDKVYTGKDLKLLFGG
ncbi:MULTISPECIES: hypothetical protein [Bacilli]|uniref:hypothetical protein n=1 Tax=Bacilli TaxID=91061 RepID=UPI001561B99E|nr:MULTISPECIES: hypothetical protein [Bacilli]MBS6061483.1 hypothetical protein [Staphylococcus sp.]MBS6506505.1 hypothetical protein [Streptococcus vestibularis]